MMARLCVAALHFNENGSRLQATTRAGAAMWQICYPKDKREYSDILRINLVERRGSSFHTRPQARMQIDSWGTNHHR